MHDSRLVGPVRAYLRRAGESEETAHRMAIALAIAAETLARVNGEMGDARTPAEYVAQWTATCELRATEADHDADE